jgi:hypothetical protein
MATKLKQTKTTSINPDPKKIYLKSGDIVKNRNGTTDWAHPDGWINVWKKNTIYDKRDVDCSALHCSNTAEVGGHVMIVEPESTKVFIIPLCSSHNSLKMVDKKYAVKSRVAIRADKSFY